MSLSFVHTLSLLPFALLGQTEPPARPSLQPEGGVDAYYAFNANRPADKANFLPGTGTSAKRAEEVGLNLASLGLSLAPQPLGFRVLLGVGTATEVVHAGETTGVAVGPEVWRVLQQAYAVWAVSDTVQLQAGVYPSHIGLEVLQTQDNWTYTRGWMGELSPYYQTGAMVQWHPAPSWTLHLHLLNGWQQIADTNRTPALGFKVAWAGARGGVDVNGFAGPELPGDDAHWRFFGDVVLKVKLTERLQLAASADAALQQRPSLPDAHWWAAGLNLRYQVSKPLAVTVRGEVFDDRDGAISGTAQRLAEGTLTLEAKPVEHLVVKLEGRYDASTAPVFSGSTLAPDGTPLRTDRQALVLLGTTVFF